MMKAKIKEYLLKILLSAVLSMVIYVLLFAIVGAILKEIKDTTISLIVLSTLVSILFSYLLFYFTKSRHGVGENEVLEDYKDQRHFNIIEDFKIIFKREKLLLILISIVIVACLILDKFDAVILKTKTISIITLPFGAMCLYSTCFPSAIDFIGYFINILVIIVSYIFFVAMNRRKQYRIWLKTGNDKQADK